MSLYGSKAYGIYDFVEIFTDTIDEYSPGNGVLIDFVRFKDGTVRAPGAVGLRADDINEITPANGIPVDGVALKDAGGTFTGSVNTDTLEELTLNVGVTCNSNLAIVAGKALQADTIAEATGANGVVVDSLVVRDGVMEAPNKATDYAQMFRTSASSAVNKDQDNKADFNGEVDPEGWVTTATDRFTAPTDGIYVATLSSGVMNPGSEGITWEVKLWKNGSQVDYFKTSFDYTTSNTILQMCSIQQLAASDYLELYTSCAGGTGANYTYSTTGVHNYVRLYVTRVIDLT